MKLSKLFPKNERTKIAFLAVCMFFDPNTDLQIINKLAPHGGLIGPGDSNLHGYLKNSKILRADAAYGCMKEQYDIGPVYVYMLSEIPSHFLLGHLTGIIFWILFKLVFWSYFVALPF